MRKLLAVLAVALAIPTMSFAGGEGRYQGVDPNSGDGIWIVDTKLGAVKYCSYIPDIAKKYIWPRRFPSPVSIRFLILVIASSLFAFVSPFGSLST